MQHSGHTRSRRLLDCHLWNRVERLHGQVRVLWLKPAAMRVCALSDADDQWVGRAMTWIHGHMNPDFCQKNEKTRTEGRTEVEGRKDRLLTNSWMEAGSATLMSRLVELVRTRLRLIDSGKPRAWQRRWYATLWKKSLYRMNCLVVILRWWSGM